MDYELLANGKLQLGDVAPNFRANSTAGEISLSKENEWFVLFSYKEDFNLIFKKIKKILTN